MNAERNSQQFESMSQGAVKAGKRLQGAGSENPEHSTDNTQ